MQEMQVRSPGGEDPLEKEMATHSSVLAWETLDRRTWWVRVHGVAKSWTRLSTHTYKHTQRMWIRKKVVYQHRFQHQHIWFVLEEVTT